MERFEINSSTDIYCIFGNPVKHSLSPAMHNAAFRELGINAVYTAFEVADIKSAIQAMKALNIRGASVTIPFKTEALEYIDVPDLSAKETGSVNTLHNNNGKIFGYNTDGYGVLKALADSGARTADSRVLIIGNGGSARAIAFSLLSEGAKVIIAGRNTKRLSPLVKDIKKKYAQIEHALIKEIDKKDMSAIDIIINTTPVGMAPDTYSTPIEPDLILKKHIVFDIVYSPNTTKLLQLSKSKGCKVTYGIDMLVCQGAKQFEIWTGKKAPVSVMERAARKYLAI